MSFGILSIRKRCFQLKAYIKNSEFRSTFAEAGVRLEDAARFSILALVFVDSGNMVMEEERVHTSVSG